MKNNLEENLKKLFKDASSIVEVATKDLTDFLEKKHLEHSEKATTAIQETLAELGLLVPISRVETKITKDSFIVTIALGKNYVSGSTTLNVSKSDKTLVVKASFNLVNDNGSINEESTFKISLPDSIVFEKPKAVFHDGDLKIGFELKNPSDELNININD